MENSHSCGGRGAEREGIQEEMEFPERWEWFPYLLPLFQCYPPHFSRGVWRWGAPAQPPECSQVKGSRASDWSVWVLELVGTGEVRQGGLPLPHPSWLCDLRRATPPVIFSLFFTFPRGPQQDFLHRVAATIKRDNVRYALGTWAWQALRAQ